MNLDRLLTVIGTAGILFTMNYGIIVEAGLPLPVALLLCALLSLPICTIAWFALQELKHNAQPAPTPPAWHVLKTEIMRWRIPHARNH